MATIIGQTDLGFKTPAYQYIRDSDKLPTYGEIANQSDPIAKVKLFNPCGQGTWYLAAYDPEDEIAFGVCVLFERELGDVSIRELTDLRLRFMLRIERDIHWTPRPLSECK